MTFHLTKEFFLRQSGVPLEFWPTAKWVLRVLTARRVRRDKKEREDLVLAGG